VDSGASVLGATFGPLGTNLTRFGPSGRKADIDWWLLVDLSKHGLTLVSFPEVIQSIEKPKPQTLNPKL
jgi:hypothetical protein